MVAFLFLSTRARKHFRAKIYMMWVLRIHICKLLRFLVKLLNLSMVYTISIVSFFSLSFSDDHIIPTFGFGDTYTTFVSPASTKSLLLLYCSDKSVFPFFPDRDPITFQEVLARYVQIAPGISMSGPTNFAPLIDKSIEIVKRLKSVCLPEIFVCKPNIHRSITSLL